MDEAKTPVKLHAFPPSGIGEEMALKEESTGVNIGFQSFPAPMFPVTVVNCRHANRELLSTQSVPWPSGTGGTDQK